MQDCDLVLTMLVANDLPEFGPNLVAALAALNVDNLTHACCCGQTIEGPAHQQPVTQASKCDKTSTCGCQAKCGEHNGW